MAYQQQQQPSSFPSDLPPRPYPNQSYASSPTATMKSRYCWAFSPSSFSPFTADKGLLARRACMLTTLVIRTAISIIMLVAWGISQRWISFAVWLIFGIIGFAGVAWCLALVGECTGTRRMLGARIDRWHWDVFLLVQVVVHVGIIAGMWWAAAAITTALWYFMWVLLALAAWIVTWPPEQESQV